jgi:hypothetical protein
MTLSSRKLMQSDKTISHGMATVAPIVTMTGALVWTESDTGEHRHTFQFTTMLPVSCSGVQNNAEY